MRPNRQHEERHRAVERKAAAQAREIIAKAERAASLKKQRRKAIAGEIVLSAAIAVADSARGWHNRW